MCFSESLKTLDFTGFFIKYQYYFLLIRHTIKVLTSK
nr:MAG TPA: hypothetical protein [Caudoviricetes sp.]